MSYYKEKRMNTRSILYASLFVLALVVSACGPTTINQEAPPPQRSLSVTGTGTANLTPDIAYVNLGVHTEKLTADEYPGGDQGEEV